MDDYTGFYIDGHAPDECGFEFGNEYGFGSGFGFGYGYGGGSGDGFEFGNHNGGGRSYPIIDHREDL